MLKLSKRFTFYDVWLWGLAGTSHSKPSLWSSPLTLMHWREFNELNFFSSLPAKGLLHLVLVTDHQHGGLHPPLPAHERSGRHQQHQGPLLLG